MQLSSVAFSLLQSSPPPVPDSDNDGGTRYGVASYRLSSYVDYTHTSTSDQECRSSERGTSSMRLANRRESRRKMAMRMSRQVTSRAGFQKLKESSLTSQLDKQAKPESAVSVKSILAVLGLLAIGFFGTRVSPPSLSHLQTMNCTRAKVVDV